MRKSRFTGTGHVFRFTLTQYLKSPSTIASMVILLVVSVASMFIASLSMSNGFVETTQIGSISIINTSSYEILPEDIRSADALLSEIPVEIFSDRESAMLQDQPVVKTAFVTVSVGEEGTSILSEKDPGYSELTDDDLHRAAAAVSAAMEDARCRTLSVDQSAIDRVFASVSTSVSTVSQTLHPQEDEVNYELRYIVSLFYSVLLMIILNFSSSYIVASVVEEKASKLVELLMVSVQPLALILGKILASMLLVLMQLMLLVVGFAASMRLSGLLFGTQAIAEMFSQVGLQQVLASLDAGTIAVLLISVLLSYLTFSLLAGLSGVRCSKMEETSDANGSVVITIMLCYAVALGTTAIAGKGVTILSLLPLVNAFIAPARYLLGEIPLSVLLGSWGVQLLVVGLLAYICQKVYGILLMRRGSRIKFRDILPMVVKRGGKQA